jgi:hypothetical protein
MHFQNGTLKLKFRIVGWNIAHRGRSNSIQPLAPLRQP